MLGYLYKNIVQNQLHLYPTLETALQKAKEEWEYTSYCAEDVKIICTNAFRIDQVNIPAPLPSGTPLYVRYPRPTVSATPLRFGEIVEATNIHL